MKNFRQVPNCEYFYDLSEKAQKLVSDVVIWKEMNTGEFVGTNNFVAPCKATGNYFHVGYSLEEVVEFFEELLQEFN